MPILWIWMICFNCFRDFINFAIEPASCYESWQIPEIVANIFKHESESMSFTLTSKADSYSSKWVKVLLYQTTRQEQMALSEHSYEHEFITLHPSKWMINGYLIWYSWRIIFKIWSFNYYSVMAQNDSFCIYIQREKWELIYG